MTPEQWSRAKALFGDLLERDPAEWPALMSGEPDDHVITEVKRLLAANQSAEGFLRDSPANSLTGEDALIGHELGPFRIERLLGEGGSGRVYLAERRGVGGHAAVKLLRGHFASIEATRRFQSEQAILARLDHPNIARLLQVGVTDDGTPWLAMEYVEGRPFREVMAELSIRNRVRMAIKLLGAIDYAHRQLVVHRDIKPGNILVDPRGEPRLLDFGIAKRMDDAAQTRTNYQPRTPAYAAPEQVLDKPITVATDVYAMGVVLYETLTGRHPWLDKGSKLDDAILEGSASLPSSVVTGAARRQLKGDLDAIVLQAMHRDPQRRYPDAGAMADDLRRFLERRPVSAQKQTLVYRTRHFVIRNYRAIAAVAMAFALLTFALIREYRLREAAALEAQKANQVADFMLEVFDAGDALTPGFAISKDSTVLDLMARGAARLESLESAPLVRADLAQKIGQVYWGLSEYGQAESLFRTAIRLREKSLGAGNETAESYLMLGRVYSRTGRYPEMLEAMQRSYDERLQALGPDDLRTIESLHRIAAANYQLQFLERGDAIALQAIEAWRKHMPDTSLPLANSLTIHALCQLRMGRFDESLRSINEALSVRGNVLPPDHNLIAEGLANRSRAQFYLGQTDEAIASIRKALDISKMNYKDDHWDAVLHYEKLAHYLIAGGQLDEANQIADKGTAMAGRIHQKNPNPELVSLASQARIEALRALGQLPAALALEREVLASRLEQLPPLHSNLITSRSVLADLLLRLDHTEEANQQLHLALESWRQRSFGYTAELVETMGNFAGAGQCDWLAADWPMKMPARMSEALERDRRICAQSPGQSLPR
jgi:eukaryotic-like serine/threonine-protein kinase